MTEEKTSIMLVMHDEPPVDATKRLRAYLKVLLMMEEDLRRIVGDPYTPKEFAALLADINKRCDRLEAHCVAHTDLTHTDGKE